MVEKAREGSRGRESGMPILSNIRHERFCHAICQNKTAAEARTGWRATRRQPSTRRRRTGHRLMRNDEVKNRVAELQAPILQKMEVTTTARSWSNLVTLANGDLGDVMVWGPNYMYAVPSERLTKQQRYMIQEIKRQADGSVSVKLRDPMPALRLLGLHRGLFSGESTATPAGDTIINNDNSTLVYVDRPPDETAEQWEAKTAPSSRDLMNRYEQCEGLWAL